MLAGRLDRRITIQRNTPVDGPLGETDAWADLATVWASAVPVRDSERVAAAQVGAEITTRFQIRWSAAVQTVNPKDRLTFDGRTFNISAVKEIGRREGLEITAAAEAD